MNFKKYLFHMYVFLVPNYMDSCRAAYKLTSGDNY